MAVSEYDAFGPWIYEVNEKHPLPQLFKGHVEELNYDMLIKIPRDIERRKANADMPLYDYIVGCYLDNIYIYEREDLKVHKKIVNINEIYALRSFNNLLFGEYHLFTADSVVTFKYNTVSNDIITQFTDLIRSKYSHVKSESFSTAIDSSEISNIDMIYKNIYNTLLKNDPSLKIMAMQSKTNLKYHSYSLFKRIYKKMMNSSLQSSLYLFNANEIILLQRGKPFTILGSVDYSNAYTYLPYQHIHSIKMDSSEQTDEVNNLNIKTHDYTFECMFMADNQFVSNLIKHLNKYCPHIKSNT